MKRARANAAKTLGFDGTLCNVLGGSRVLRFIGLQRDGDFRRFSTPVCSGIAICGSGLPDAVAIPAIDAAFRAATDAVRLLRFLAPGGQCTCTVARKRGESRIGSGGSVISSSVSYTSLVACGAGTS